MCFFYFCIFISSVVSTLNWVLFADATICQLDTSYIPRGLSVNVTSRSSIIMIERITLFWSWNLPSVWPILLHKEIVSSGIVSSNIVTWISKMMVLPSEMLSQTQNFHNGSSFVGSVQQWWALNRRDFCRRSNVDNTCDGRRLTDELRQFVALCT